jgi:predicted NBD/HSP70 family sugar kinase
MYLVLDIGGTNSRVALFNDDLSKRPVVLEYLKLDNDFSKDWKKIYDLIRYYHAGDFKGAVMAIAGALDKNRKKLINSPHLSSFQGVNLFDLLTNSFNCKASIFNDTYLAAYGEAFGNKQNKDFWYINWGSGIGGSLVRREGKGFNIFNAEPGHMRLDSAGIKCNCGQSGCWDSLVGGKAIELRYNKHAWDLILKEWTEVVNIMTQGLLNTLVVAPTELVIMGGGISINQPEMVELLEVKLKEMIKIYPAPKLQIAKFEDLSAIYGGFFFLKASV